VSEPANPEPSRDKPRTNKKRKLQAPAPEGVRENPTSMSTAALPATKRSKPPESKNSIRNYFAPKAAAAPPSHAVHFDLNEQPPLQTTGVAVDNDDWLESFDFGSLLEE
jgi:hypothetical protein